MTPVPLDVSDVEGLGSGVTDGLAEPGEVVVLLDGEADAPPVGAWPPQLADGSGSGSASRRVGTCWRGGWNWRSPTPLAEALSLGLALPVGLALALVALPFGLALALSVPVGLAVTLWDGLAVLGDAVTLGLVGALVAAVDRVGLDVPGFEEADACDGDGDKHGTADGLVIPSDALPSTPLAEEPWPVPPAPGELGVLLEEPATRSALAWTKCRSGGTAASTTARANTATPTASAGRSMASRQSMGRRWAGRACPGPAPCPGARPAARPGRGGAP